MENKHDKVLAIGGFLLLASLAALAAHIRDNPDLWYPPERLIGAPAEFSAQVSHWDTPETKALLVKENPEPWDIRQLPDWQLPESDLEPLQAAAYREFEVRVQQHPDSAYLPSTRAAWVELDAVYTDTER